MPMSADHARDSDERAVFSAHAEVMRLLSNPMRHEIFHRIAEGPATVTALAERTGSSKAAVSQHVTALRTYGLVSAERRGRSVIFTLTYPELAQACELIDRVLADQAARTTRRLNGPDVGYED